MGGIFFLFGFFFLCVWRLTARPVVLVVCCVSHGSAMEVMEVAASESDIDTRTTTRYLTKYERARVIGTRALQLR